MVVECYGRRTYAKGVIKQVLHRKTSNGYRLSKARIHLYPGFRTKGGDSGAVWVEEKSKCPIGLHCGSLKKNAYVDVAHSVVDIAKRFKFQFHPLAKSRVLAAELDPFETCFVKQSDGFLAVCHRNGYDVKAKKFGNDFSKKNEKAVNTNYKQVRGLAAVSRPGVKSPAGDTVIGFWLSSDWHQTKGCKIQMGSLNNGRTKMNFGKILNFRSHFSPAVTWFDNKFVLAFTDGSTGKLNIATSANGKTWSRKTTTAAAFSAPSITVFNGQLYLSWVAPSPYVPWPNNTRGQVKIGTLKPDGRSYTIASSKKVTCHNATAFSPSICASDKNLFLAYTDSNNKIEIMNSTRTSGWTQYKAFQTKSAIAPTLFFFEDELVCSRRTNVASSY